MIHKSILALLLAAGVSAQAALNTGDGGYKSLISNLANWTVDTVNGSYSKAVPDRTAFTVTAVPEPKNYAMLLAGLGVMGFIAARRNR